MEENINFGIDSESLSRATPIEGTQAASTADELAAEPADTRNIFDRIGDFFFRMVKGVFIFAILKLPRLIWRCVTCVEYLKFLLKYTKSILWAVFWFTTWVAIVFAAWMAFGWEAFVGFWTAVGDLLLDLFIAIWNVIYGNFGVIWMVIALIGSVYGLIFVTLKKRRSRLNGNEKVKAMEKK